MQREVKAVKRCREGIYMAEGLALRIRLEKDEKWPESQLHSGEMDTECLLRQMGGDSKALRKRQRDWETKIYL